MLLKTFFILAEFRSDVNKNRFGKEKPTIDRVKMLLIVELIADNRNRNIAYVTCLVH